MYLGLRVRLLRILNQDLLYERAYSNSPVNLVLPQLAYWYSYTFNAAHRMQTRKS